MNHVPGGQKYPGGHKPLEFTEGDAIPDGVDVLSPARHMYPPVHAPVGLTRPGLEQNVPRGQSEHWSISMSPDVQP